MRFNVIYRDHSSDINVPAEYLKGMPDIAWVYIIQANRLATEIEVNQLVRGTWKGV